MASDEFRVTCKDLAGEEFEFTLTPRSTVLDVFELYSVTKGMPIDMIRLIYAGKQLTPNEDLISEHGVTEDGTVLHVVSRLRGN
jgi:hypothetical protein